MRPNENAHQLRAIMLAPAQSNASLTAPAEGAAKAVGARAAQGHIRTLLALFEVAPITRAVLTDALDLELADYEDAVLHEAARHAGADAIVTRDSKGFSAAQLKLYAPDELLRFLAAAFES